MIEFRIAVGGRTWRVLGGLAWTNLDALDSKQSGGRPRLPETHRPPLRLLRRAMHSRHVRTGVCLRDAAEPPNWMLGHATKHAGDAVSALAWLAHANPDQRILYVHQQEAGPTWVVACDQGRIALSPEVDALIGNDQTLRTAIDGLLEHWTSEDTPFRVVLNLRNRITTPMLERAIQRGLAAPGHLQDLLQTAPPPAARLQRLLPLPLGHALVFATILLTVAWWAGDWYWRMRERQQAFNESQRRILDANVPGVPAVDAAAQDATAQEMAVHSALREDTTTLDPQSVIVSCANLLKELHGYVPAWRLERIDCDPGGDHATAHWRLPFDAGRPQGTHDDFAPLAHRADLSFHADYQHVAGTFRLPARRPREGLRRDSLPRTGDWIRDLGQKVQRLRHAAKDIGATVSEPKPRAVDYQVPVDPAVAKTTGPRMAPVDAERTYETGQVAVSGRGPMSLLGMNLVEPNLSLNKLSVSPQGTNWIWNVELKYFCRR